MFCIYIPPAQVSKDQKSSMQLIPTSTPVRRNSNAVKNDFVCWLHVLKTTPFLTFLKLPGDEPRHVSVSVASSAKRAEHVQTPKLNTSPLTARVSLYYRESYTLSSARIERSILDPKRVITLLERRRCIFSLFPSFPMTGKERDKPCPCNPHYFFVGPGP
jgi:hypothetical protein